MKKFNLQLDTDSINKENEEHANSFNMKVKHLAEHCIQFIEGTHNEINCTDNKFDRNIHDTQEVVENINTLIDNDIKNRPKIIKQIIKLKVTDFQNITKKLL